MSVFHHEDSKDAVIPAPPQHLNYLQAKVNTLFVSAIAKLNDIEKRLSGSSEPLAGVTKFNTQTHLTGKVNSTLDLLAELHTRLDKILASIGEPPQ